MLTIAIRNREQRVIGLLCINMNLMPFSQIMNTFIPPETPEVGSAVNFASSVEEDECLRRWSSRSKK